MTWPEVVVYCFVSMCISYTIVGVIRAAAGAVEVDDYCDECGRLIEDEARE